MNRVLRLPAFRRLVFAYGLNEVAVQVAAVVLAAYVYRRTGSALGAAAFFLAAQFVPAFLSPALVARLHRPDLSRILPALYAVEVVLFAGLAAGVATGLATGPLLVLTLIDGIVALSARSLARVASVTVTAPAGLLREGNALINVVFSGCYLAGPALGGLLLLIGTTTSALIVDAVVFGAIAVVLAMAPTIPGGGDDSRERPRLRAAFAYARRDPFVRRQFGVRGAALILFTISVPVEVVLAQHTLHGGAAGYALLLTGWGAGTVLGSAIYTVARRVATWRMLALGAGLLAIGFLAMGVAPTLAAAIPGAVLGGTGNGIDAVSSRTSLQEGTDPHWMALVMALNESLWQALPGVGVLIGGTLAALAGARVAMGVAAAGAALVVVLTCALLRDPGPGAATDLSPDARLAAEADHSSTAAAALSGD